MSWFHWRLFSGSLDLTPGERHPFPRERTERPEFREYQRRVKDNAAWLAQCLVDKGLDIVTGGAHPLDQFRIETAFKLEGRRLLPPHLAEQPARCGDSDVPSARHVEAVHAAGVP